MKINKLIQKIIIFFGLLFLVSTNAFAVVELDADADGYIDASKGGVVIKADCSTITAGLCLQTNGALYAWDGDSVEQIGTITTVLGKTSGDVDVLFQAWTAFTGADATPDVSTGSLFRTVDTTTITDFDGTPVDGQFLYVYCGAATVFDFTSSGLEAYNRTSDYTSTIGEILAFKYQSTQWYCQNVPPDTMGIAMFSSTSPTANEVGEYDLDTNGDGVTITQGVYNIHDGTQLLYFFGVDAYPTLDGQRQEYDSGTNKMVWASSPSETNSLETTITGIADTEIFIGNGSNSGTFVVMSGDATLSNGGALSLATGSVDSNELVSTAVTPGSYTFSSITVDADGRITAASSGSPGAETNSLETTITGIADTEIFIGNGSNSGTFVAISGDITITNGGVASLATDSVAMNEIDSDGNFVTLTGNWYTTGELNGKLDINDDSATGTIGTQDCYGGVVTNTGATGAIVLTLPSATKGMSVLVTLTVAQDVDINPDGTDRILVETDANGDALSSDATIGSTLSLVAVSSTEWMVVGKNGTWTDVN